MPWHKSTERARPEPMPANCDVECGPASPAWLAAIASAVRHALPSPAGIGALGGVVLRPHGRFALYAIALSAPAMASWTEPLLASTCPASTWHGAPSVLLTWPPASVTMSAPAARSHGCTRCSQYPSSRPHAT